MGYKPERNLTKNRERVKHYRMEIIEWGFVLETQLEIIISLYFSRNREDYRLLRSLFFTESAGLGFNNKIEMFTTLLKTSMKEFHENYPEVVNQLNKIKQIRNKFAHSYAMNIDLKDLKPLEDKVHLRTTKKGNIEIIPYSFDELDDILEKSRSLNRILAKLLNDLRTKNLKN